MESNGWLGIEVRHLAALGAGEAGMLRVGTYQSVGQRILPELIRRYRAAWPRVDVRVTERNTDDELVELIEHGDVDLSFADMTLWDGPFEWVDLFEDPYVLLVQADSPLAARTRPPTLAEIAELPLIGFRTCRSIRLLESHFEARGLRPEFVFRSDDNGTVQGMVGAGIGVAIVPRLTVELNDARTAVVELGDVVPPRRITLVWHRDRYRSAAARAFVEIAHEVCADFSRARVAALAN